MSENKMYTIKVYSSEEEFYKGNLYRMEQEGFIIKEKGIVSIFIKEETLNDLKKAPFLFLETTRKPEKNLEEGIADFDNVSYDHGVENYNYLPVRIFSSVDK